MIISSTQFPAHLTLAQLTILRWEGDPSLSHGSFSVSSISEFEFIILRKLLCLYTKPSQEMDTYLRKIPRMGKGKTKSSLESVPPIILSPATCSKCVKGPDARSIIDLPRSQPSRGWNTPCSKGLGCARPDCLFDQTDPRET